MKLIALCGASGLLLGCGDSSGPSHDLSITVVVTTFGLHQDPDGYIVSLGDAERAAPANGRVEYSRVNEREQMLMMRGIAGNCRVVGENPRTISMSAGWSWREHIPRRVMFRAIAP